MNFWNFAFHQSVFIINYIPRNKNAVSAWKIFRNCTRPVMNILPFGCRVFAFNHQTTHKTAKRNIVGIFLGYDKSTKIAFVFENGTDRIIRSSSIRGMYDLFPRKENDQSNDAEYTESGTISSSMAGSSTHTSDVSDPDVSIAGDEDSYINETAAGTSYVENDESSSSDVSSPVSMDIDQNTSIDSIEAPLPPINNKSTPIETFTTPIVTEPVDPNETGTSSKIKPKNYLLRRN